MMSKRTQEAIRRVPNGAIITSVLSNLGLFQVRTSEDEFDELISVGFLALVKAESEYKPDSGFSLSTHVYGKIRWAIIDELRKPKGFYGRIVSMRLRSMRCVANQLSHQSFARPTRKQIADEMGLSQDQVDALVSAETSISDTTDMDLLVSENRGESILELLEFESEVKLLRKKIAELKPVEREIIRLYYMEELPSDVIAQQLGYSTSSLRNLKALTQRKLRMAMMK